MWYRFILHYADAHFVDSSQTKSIHNDELTERSVSIWIDLKFKFIIFVTTISCEYTVENIYIFKFILNVYVLEDLCSFCHKKFYNKPTPDHFNYLQNF